MPSGQGRLLAARGNVMAFKAVAAQTGGDFSLMERTVPPGARIPPPHRHVNCSEAFFVLDGTITFWLEAAELAAGRGLPAGAARVGPYVREPGRRAGPAAGAARPGHGRLFRRAGRAVVRRGAAAAEAERELMSRYGMEPAG